MEKVHDLHQHRWRAVPSEQPPGPSTNNAAPPATAPICDRTCCSSALSEPRKGIAHQRTRGDQLSGAGRTVLESHIFSSGYRETSFLLSGFKTATSK